MKKYEAPKVDVVVFETVDVVATSASTAPSMEPSVEPSVAPPAPAASDTP